MSFRFFIFIFTSLFLNPSAKAQDDASLNVYTYDSFASEWGPAPLLKQGFEKTCDCTINFIPNNSSIGALRKIQLDGEKSDADILLGIDTSIAAEAKASGLFAQHDVDLSDIKLPTKWKSDYFVPFDYGYFAFVYNKEKLPNPPASFEDLITSNIKIVIQDPRSSTTGLGLVLWLKTIYGEGANKIWQQLKPNVITVTKGWSESYNLFLKGEADMVLSYTTSPAYHLIAEDDNRFAAASFLEGHYMQIEVAGILQASKNKQLASEFLSWLISDEAQAIIPTSNWMYPVAEVELPKGFEALIQPENALILADDLVQKNSNIWIEEMLSAFR